MLKKKQIEVLKKFRDYVIKQSRANLTRKKKSVSRNLYDSLEGKFHVSANSFSLQFLMEEYGTYQDKGVSGVEKKYDTPFKFTKKKPPIQPLADWAKARGMKLRDAEGKFKKGGIKSLGFALSNHIFQHGIKPSLFFTKPFEAAFKRLPKDFIDAYGLDFEKFLDYSLEEVIKE